ncbi:MAG: tetratricopeptide repeat protein [candidate division WOR-3 bacterium]
MYGLIIILLALLVVALYPVIRDMIRRRRASVPSYVEGLQLLLDNRPREAEQRLREAIEADTSNVDAYVRLGDLLIERGDIERGIRLHENLALRRNMTPQDERRVFRALVRDYLRTDRKARAIATLEELVRSDSADFDSHARLLELYVETGAWDKCPEMLKPLAKSDMSRAHAAALYAEFGRAYAQVNPKGAEQWLNEALKLDRNSLAARVYLGDALMARGEVEAAIKTWTELLDRAPEKNALVRARLERAYYESGRYDEIVQLYERLLRRVPDDAGLALSLALIYDKKEDPTGAARLLQRLSRGPAAIPEIRAALAALLLHAGDTSGARHVLDELLSRPGLSAPVCRLCARPLGESVLKCPHCKAWQDLPA